MSSSEALVEAAKTGDLLKVRELIRASPALANTRLASGESPIMAALYRGHRDVVHELVESIGTVDVFAAAALGRLDDLREALRRPGAVNDVAYDGWMPPTRFTTRASTRPGSASPTSVARRCASSTLTALTIVRSPAP